HDVGLAYPSAIGLWGGGDGYVVEHNEVHDTTYSAMICGGSDGRVESNLIYNAMTVLHDGAGIYSGGAKGLVMRGNFIRDIVDTGGYGASAYYLDEMCENCVVEGNLSLRVVRPSHNHWAGPNTVRGNVFVSDADMNVTFPRCKDYTFEQNVMWARGKITFRNAAAVTSMPGNVLFSGADEVVAVGLKDYAEGERVPLAPTGGTVLADPLLDAGDLERGVCRFAPDSPVHGLGLKTLDVSDAGPRPE
ncbi:MAG: right-handed parallel beta-helix repeat-containing protein, partial [Candidatus Brocadiae bacterium]|nr:right-handed parallel beta-helix repeat-containing protein [Candidatus Brocadiia bacterium]